MTIKTPKFLRALYDLLDVESPAIIAWSSCGTYFQVYDVVRLEQEMLPRYFKHNKIASFQRQLNNFGFRKWTKTQASICTFSHEVYVRCQPHELQSLVETSAWIVPKSSPSHKRPRTISSDLESIISKKIKCEEPETMGDVDLLALDWSILSTDNQVDEFIDDDDSVGLPIELFFSEEKTIDPLSLDETSVVDVLEWRLLAEYLV